MNILILGDVCGPAGRKIIKEKLPQLIKKKKIDFVILNGENADDSGVGITKKITELMIDKKALDITLIDLKKITPLTDYFIICTSERSLWKTERTSYSVHSCKEVCR